MDYKLMVVDIDNTLLCTDKSLSEKNKEAIQICKEKGVMFSLATGRASRDVYYQAQMYGVEENYHISDNGACIFKKENVQLLKKFNKEYSDYMIREIKARDMELGVFSASNPNFTYQIGNKDIDKFMQKYFLVTKQVEDDIAKIPDVYKIVAYYRNEKELEFLKSLEKEGEMTGVIPDPGIVDMMPYNVTKIQGTRKLADILGIDMSQVIAVGDQQNDYTNIEGAGLGIAVSNAIDDVKDIADVVLEQSCDEDAIYEVVKRYVL